MTMRFYFDVHHDQETDRDTLGIEAPSLEAAVRYVVATVQDFISEDRPLAARIHRAMVEITDRKDTSVVVSFAKVFHNMPNYGSSPARVGKMVFNRKVLTAHPPAQRMARARPALAASASEALPQQSRAQAESHT